MNNGYCVFGDNCGIHRFIGNSCAAPRQPMGGSVSGIPVPGAGLDGIMPHRRIGGYTGRDDPSARTRRINLRGYRIRAGSTTNPPAKAKAKAKGNNQKGGNTNNAKGNNKGGKANQPSP